MPRPLVKSGPPDRVTLVTACVGNLATCSEMRAAFGTVLAPWGARLGIEWLHRDDFTRMHAAEILIDALVIAPPMTTWTRARHLTREGPQALRDLRWPWGLPSVKGADRDKVEDENAALRDGLKMIDDAISLNPSLTFALLAPEDRGALGKAQPASIWQLRELRRWARRRDLRRGAVNQCELGMSPTPRPLGVLLHSFEAGGSYKHEPLHPGWPRFSPAPGRHYIGPLPRKCRCGTAHGKAQPQDSDSSTWSSPSAATFFANLLLLPHLRKRSRALGLFQKGLGMAQSSEKSYSTEDDSAYARDTDHEDYPSSFHYNFDDISDSDRTWPEPSDDDFDDLPGPYDDWQLNKDLFNLNSVPISIDHWTSRREYHLEAG